MDFFEGSEKKFEVIVTGAVKSLRTRGRDFWTSIVKASGANILSVLSNERIDAYLLSESCLLVWDDRVLMITCGRTRLIDALLCFLETLDEDKIKFLFYQRKNEFWVKDQPSSFFGGRKYTEIKGQGEGYAFW